VAEKAWGGRFSEPTNEQVELFTESISFDARLAAVDVQGSLAHAKMLAKVGLISDDERDLICVTLDEILQTIQNGEMEFRASLEDIHMHIESALIERIGDVGRKLHTGRSRNDQVSTDIKLYIRSAIDEVDTLLETLQRAFVSRGEDDFDIILPGYTHLQRAQPVNAVHYWLAYAEKFQRDRNRLSDCRARLNQCPVFFESADRDGSSNAFESGTGGYGYNRSYIGSTAYMNDGLRALQVTTRDTRIQDPSNTILFADAALPQSNSIIEYGFSQPPTTHRAIWFSASHLRPCTFVTTGAPTYSGQTGTSPARNGSGHRRPTYTAHEMPSGW